LVQEIVSDEGEPPSKRLAGDFRVDVEGVVLMAGDGHHEVSNQQGREAGLAKMGVRGQGFGYS
jgi:hypothetical protein